MTFYLGIDIASKKFDAALLCNGSYRCKAFANSAAGFTALVKWAGEGDFSEIHACMEATGLPSRARDNSPHFEKCASRYTADCGRSV